MLNLSNYYYCNSVYCKLTSVYCINKLSIVHNLAINNCFAGAACQQKKLKPDAVPSVFQWTNKNQLCKAQLRRNRAEKRQSQREKSEILPSVDIGFECEVQTTAATVCEKVETQFTFDIGCECEAQTTVITTVCDAVSETSSTELQFVDAGSQCNFSSFCIEKFEFDAPAIHFYTGLENFDRLLVVFNSLGPAVNYLKHHGGRQIELLSPINQLFLTLIKLRCNKTSFELSRLFEISETSVENIFITWINFMYHQWSEISIWPSRDLVRYYMPSDFKQKFLNTRVIFDATECPVKKPKTPRAQQSTFSTYKNRNTVKILVGASPGGLVSYISMAYGGSTTDRQIVERSNICSICDPGDSIMADKGFNVQDMFQHANITINIPTFFRKRNRMDGKTVLHDRKIASKRVHIERIIGLAKTYKMLTQPMLPSYALLATEITTVCFMLCNFRTCIVPNTA